MYKVKKRYLDWCLFDLPETVIVQYYFGSLWCATYGSIKNELYFV